MHLERLFASPKTARALHAPDADHVAWNERLLGAPSLRDGPGVFPARVSESACARMERYYRENHNDAGLLVGGTRKGGFGALYPNTHGPTDHVTQKRMTVVERNDRAGRARAAWAVCVDGFAEIEEAARAAALEHFPTHGDEFRTSAWHTVEQTYAEGASSTSFSPHVDDEEEPHTTVTVVVKLTEGFSRMAIEGASRSFAYGWERGHAAVFDARAWHRSVPIRAWDPDALKIAFFFRPLSGKA